MQNTDCADVRGVYVVGSVGEMLEEHIYIDARGTTFRKVTH